MLLSANPLVAARRAVTLIFLANGTVFGLWAGHIPLVKAGLGLSDAALGGALLAMALGAIAMMPVTGWITSRHGSRGVTIASGVAFGLLLALPLLTDAWWQLALTTLLLGAANGAMDVAMNTQAAAVQRAWGRAIMSAFHAFYSLGGLLGAGLAALLLTSGLDAHVYLAVLALLLGLGVLLLAPALIRDVPQGASEGGGGFRLPHGAGLALGVLALLAFLSEGAMLDWSAVYLSTALLAPAGVAALGYGAFSAAMTIGRLTGDHFVRRVGDRRALILSGAVAGIGLAWALLAPAPWLAIPGFALTGIGLANAVPILFSAGAHIPGLAPGAGVAMVATMGYAGALLGPAVIGFAAEAMGLPAALWMLALACLAIAASALAGYGAPAKR